jgi:hypothetical protein
MRAFFRSWRRIARCVTLVMALILSAGWVRSFLVEDRFYIDLTGTSINRLVSSLKSLPGKYRIDLSGVCIDALVQCAGQQISERVGLEDNML